MESARFDWLHSTTKAACASNWQLQMCQASSGNLHTIVALQAQAFASWKDMIAFCHVKRSAMSDSIRRLLQGTLGRVFAAWNIRVHEQAALKQKAAMCLARLANTHIASAFAAWLDWAAEQKDHRY